MRHAAPWTYPSVVTMFSGLYPQQHGAEGHVRQWDLLYTFSRDVPLLHKVLKAAGYETKRRPRYVAETIDPTRDGTR